jgi:hypothetical protein
MRKSIVAALAFTGAVLVGPAAALAAPVDPVGSLPGYGLDHAGHDHGAKPEPKHEKDHDGKHDGKHDGHHHGDGHNKKYESDSAHASGGYDSHRSHPR